MATMYSLFLGFLFTAVCSDNGGGSGVLKPDVAIPSYVMSLCPDASGTVVEGLFRFLGTSTDFIEIDFNNPLFSRKSQLSFSMTRISFFSLMKKTKQKKSRLGQYDAKYFLTGLNISEPLHFAPLHRYVFNDHQKIFLTLYRPRSFEDEKSRARTVSQPRPFYSVSASTSLQLEIMSPVKQLAIKDDLLAYGDQGRKATNRKAVYFALGQESQSKGGIGGQETLGPACVALRSHDEHRVNSLDLCGTFYQGKVPRQFANEDKRKLIINIASTELGVREATGNNDGPRVEEYLRYTNLSRGYEWCAAFVSWVYGQAGFAVPRNAWSPALFPKARLIVKGKAQQADVFGVYGAKAKRINHVGLVKELSKDYLITIEGNSNDRVESRRRHLKTVYAVGDWVNEILVFST